MVNHIQVSSGEMNECPTVSLLSALLEHAEFRQGVADAQDFFYDLYEEAPLTEEEMIEEVEMNVSRRSTQHSREFCRLKGEPPSSYLYNLGFVIGTIDKGLTYLQ